MTEITEINNSSSALLGMLSSLDDVANTASPTTTNNTSSSSTSSLANMIADFYANQKVDEEGNVTNEGTIATSTTEVKTEAPKKKKKGLFGKIASGFAKVAQVVSSAVQFVYPAIGTALTNISKMLEGVVDKGKDFLQSLASALTNSVTNNLEGIANGLTSTATDYIDNLSDSVLDKIGVEK
ncbi:MAG: hypothetical protein LBE20_06555 [Deltaproteobacteria bacterium]|nr:hypothetical protein [Deltaproteobacteria bacterium]